MRVTSSLARLETLTGQLCLDHSLVRASTIDASGWLLEKLLVQAVSPSRCKHSLEVAGLCQAMAGEYGLDPEKAKLAGLAHDLCKELPEAEQLALAVRCPVPVFAEALKNPRFLHGPAGAVFLRENAVCTDPDICAAVARHTIGGPELQPLELLVYAADKLEDSRGTWARSLREEWLEGKYPGVAGLAELSRRILTLIVEHCRARGHAIASSAPDLYNELNRLSGTDPRQALFENTVDADGTLYEKTAL